MITSKGTWKLINSTKKHKEILKVEGKFVTGWATRSGPTSDS